MALDREPSLSRQPGIKRCLEMVVQRNARSPHAASPTNFQKKCLRKWRPKNVHGRELDFALEEGVLVATVESRKSERAALAGKTSNPLSGRREPVSRFRSEQNLILVLAKTARCILPTNILLILGSLEPLDHQHQPLFSYRRSPVLLI